MGNNITTGILRGRGNVDTNTHTQARAHDNHDRYARSLVKVQSCGLIYMPMGLFVIFMLLRQSEGSELFVL